MFVCVVWLLLRTDLVGYVNGIQIQECKNDAVEAVENTISPVTCADYTGLVSWRYQLPIADSAMTQIGTCGATCTVDSDFPPTFGTLTWLSASSSRLNLSSTVTARQYANTTLFCGMEQCNLAINVNAVLGALTVNLSNTGNGWTVTGTVGITKVFSSNEQYRCVWSRRYGNGQYTAVTTKILFPEPNPNNEDKSGTCDLTDNMPNTTGTYTYRVQVYPGATEKTDSSVVIASPPVPSIRCTPITGYVSEDTDVSCTCSGSVGRPAGRLVWVRRINNVDTSVKVGSYGQDSLQLTMTVNRSHNGNELRCDVYWVTDTTGPAYTVNVARPASNVTFGMGGNKELTINESDIVTFDCQSRGRPSPELLLAQGNTVLQRAEGGKLSLSEVSTRLTHTITAQCDNTGLYTCSAHNGVGGTQQDTAQLYVNCKPRCNSTCSAAPLVINYENNEAVAVEIGLVAFPVPEDNSFTFRVNGSDNTISDNITLSVTCDTGITVYDVVCTLLVSNVTDKEAEGLYTFTAANAFGQEDFLFEVIVNGTMDSAAKREDNIGAVVGGTCGAVLVVGAAAVALFKARQLRKAAKKSRAESAVSPPVSVELEEQQHARSNEMQDDKQQATYTSLQYQDIGAPSDYVELRAGPVYANTC